MPASPGSAFNAEIVLIGSVFPLFKSKITSAGLLVCAHAIEGSILWTKDLVKEFGHALVGCLALHFADRERLGEDLLHNVVGRTVLAVGFGLGVGLALSQLVSVIWRPDARVFPQPSWLRDTVTVFGARVPANRFLLIADGEAESIGGPVVEFASVSAEILRRDRGEKLISFKYRPKARRRVKKGHRQELTFAPA